ncbi:hypothetical protein CHLNCDRAFT_57293 [Chlorella variabilis]|uniref:Uncharacterized protein n=1 Tax=Chlorella variabilis TaxID=554065 RepID=E1Z9H6_CHLVA|nr:hypothetical protein CHLNCDRAFT_57293 [Chlorella variabilis]EFN57778.1 hypothetical protein CHLNCDRAFT_57293 [Chlorella variabilis]|eukprot:XP_005849880.1 hypothetical protein CHLNCDRAFT_57293 [Chlorella variabilis]
MADSTGSGVSPGGPRISSAKKRRLAALEQNLGAVGPGGGGAAHPRGSTAPPLSGSSGAPKAPKARSSGGGRGARGGSAGGEQPPLPLQQQQQQQQQAWEPPYNRLEDAIATGPAAGAMDLPPPQPGSQVVSELLVSLMATNPRAFDARAAIGLKVQDRTVMLDNPAGQKQQRRRRQQPSRWAAQLASKAQQRRLGLYQLQTTGLTYEAVQPLYRSWQQYMQELLAPGVQDVEARLYGADLHGCLIRVSAMLEPRYQGLRGIVVRDTANTLQLVTPENRFVVVPKRACTWEFDADRRRVVTLLGPGLAQRCAGAGGSSSSAGGPARPKTLREAIRSQQRR